MNVSGIRRNVKNIAHNYTEAQRKVRESTSNDPWGPPSSLMAEIADLTYNVVAFSEIMQMIWKRLNDHGKNWRHVYKSLVLLDYLIKTGSEKVAQQCKENIFAIQTLKDFQYYEDNKDQGLNVREKAKQLVSLLKDDERLKNERSKALKARERFAQQVTSGSDPHEPMYSPSSPPVPDFSGYRSESYGSDTALSRGRPASVELDLARPQTAGEEELQLQLALAMSREEAEQEEARRRSDDVRLALAITQSKTEVKPTAETSSINSGNSSHLLDLLDVNIGGATGGSDTPVAGWVDPWGTPAHPSEPPAPAMPPRPKVPGSWSPCNPFSVSVPHFPSVSFSQPGQDSFLDTSQKSLDFTTALQAMSSPSPAAALSTPANRSVMVDPWGMPLQNGSSPVVQDPWTSTTPSPVTVPAAAAVPAAVDPWAPASVPSQKPDPWSPVAASIATKPAPSNDPWSPQVQGAQVPNALDDFDVLLNRKAERNNNASPFDLQEMNSALNLSNTDTEGGQVQTKKTPENFLGLNSSLVNLDNLLPPRPAAQPPVNPFALTMPGVAGTQANPFQQQMAPRPSINQLRQQQNLGILAPPMGDGVMMAAQPAAPWSGIPPTNTLGSPTSNPFLA